MKFDELVEWRTALAKAHEGPKFMTLPEAWMDDPHWFCINGHVSGRYLGTEVHGNLCLACREKVVLGPKMGEAEFKRVIDERR